MDAVLRDVVVLAKAPPLVAALDVVPLYVVLSPVASPVIVVSEGRPLCAALPDTAFPDAELSGIPSPAVVLSAESAPDDSFWGDRHPNIPVQNTARSRHIPRFQCFPIFSPPSARPPAGIPPPFPAGSSAAFFTGKSP